MTEHKPKPRWNLIQLLAGLCLVALFISDFAEVGIVWRKDPPAGAYWALIAIVLGVSIEDLRQLMKDFLRGKAGLREDDK